MPKTVLVLECIEEKPVLKQSNFRNRNSSSITLENWICKKACNLRRENWLYLGLSTFWKKSSYYWSYRHSAQISSRFRWDSKVLLREFLNIFALLVLHFHPHQFFLALKTLLDDEFLWIVVKILSANKCEGKHDLAPTSQSLQCLFWCSCDTLCTTAAGF